MPRNERDSGNLSTEQDSDLSTQLLGTYFAEISEIDQETLGNFLE
jgi:hypothetical protein